MASMRDVFWRFGFEATSLDMLCAATAINRPSLYAAFGDKRAIYRTVLRRFMIKAESEFDRALDEPPTFREALAAFYGHAIGLYTNEKGGRGCLALCTLMPMATEDTQLREVLSQVISNADAAVERRIGRAVQEGELSGDAPVLALSAACSAILQSISIRARAGADVHELRRFAASVDHLFLPWLRR